MPDPYRPNEVSGRQRPRLRQHKPRKEPFVGIFLVGLGFFYGTVALILLLIFLGFLKGDEMTMEIENKETISRIGFGSCHRQSRAAPILQTIIRAKPQVFIFLGDNVYADTEDMDKMRAAYDKLLNKPAFKSLNDAAVLLATWDDHDYGDNDLGREYPAKAASEKEFYRAWSIPINAATRQREGVYSSYLFGSDDQRVQIILLDTRYHRSPHVPNPKSKQDKLGKWAIQKDKEATVLGEAQWAWFEEQLRTPARIRIIGSSIQFLSSEHRFERWALFPKERERFLNAMRKTQAEGVIIISGDRHFAEISVLPGTSPQGLGYPLYDITSSSLNSPLPSHFMRKEPNRYRVGSQRFNAANFGWIEIDWSTPSPKISLQIRDISGRAVMKQDLALGDLQPAPATSQLD